MAISNFSQVATTPYPLVFDSLLYRVREYPDCFDQTYCEGGPIDYQDGLGHFPFGGNHSP